MKKDTFFTPSCIFLFLLPLLFTGCDAPTASATAAPVTETTAVTVPEPVAEPVGNLLTLYVNNQTGKAGADGTEKSPFATLKEAVAKVNATTEGIDGVVVKVAPGIYREGGLNLQQRSTPVTIESSDPEQEVIISGADVWKDWDVSYGVLSAPWPHDWGDAKFGGWPAGDLKDLKPMGARSEMVFVNGQLLRQVPANKSLRSGQFSVDLNAKKLSVRLPEGVEVQDALIEVSTRPHLLFAGALPGLTLRNLAFTQANNGSMHPGLGSWAVLLAGEQDQGTKDHGEAPISVNESRAFLRNLLIENCRFEWNNSGGLTMANVIGVEVRDSHFDHNGTSGVGANRCKDVLYEDCTFDGNNWRYGKWGHCFGWAPAGTKQLFISDAVYRRCSFSRNYATGLWMDFGNENIVVEDCIMEDNWYVGFYFEASYGPCIVKNSRILRNGYLVKHDFAVGGVLFAESKGLTLEDCEILDNANYQIGLRSRERKSSGYWSKTRFDGLCENLTVNRCVIRGGYYPGENTADWFSDLHRLSTLIGATTHSNQDWYKKFIPTYKGDHNTFINGFGEKVFSKGGNYGLARVDLEEWRSMTGQDQNSTFHESMPEALR